MGEHHNRMGKRMLTQESQPLRQPSLLGCQMCRWLEKGYQTGVGAVEIEAYAVEILLHRRLSHISSPDNLN